MYHKTKIALLFLNFKSFDDLMKIKQRRINSFPLLNAKLGVYIEMYTFSLNFQSLVPNDCYSSFLDFLFRMFILSLLNNFTCVTCEMPRSILLLTTYGIKR